MESPHAALIESTLMPVNDDLTRLLTKQRGAIPESDILRVMKLMAGIRTRALEKGWEQESDADLEDIQSILERHTHI
jgi:hypothetical protein